MAFPRALSLVRGTAVLADTLPKTEIDGPLVREAGTLLDAIRASYGARVSRMILDQILACEGRLYLD